MVFSSVIFLWVLLPVILGCYYLSPRPFRNGLLMVFSLFFYAWGEPKYIVLMVVSVLMNYGFGIGMEICKKKKILLVLCVACNLLILGYYKYSGFLIETLNHVLAGTGRVLSAVEVTLPIGISFYTFQALSYVVDVYRGENRAQRNLVNMMLYISFFPQLIAGPIVKYHEIEEQIENRTVTMETFSCGVKRFILGLGKKVILANSFAEVVDAVWGYPAGRVSIPLLWMTALLYMLQIYFDFSGYSDMAIGLGRMFGFTFRENFLLPYTASSVRDFWRKWHISLSGWFREYVYIPLGGNRKGTVRTYLNLGIVFLLTGIWHGAGWTFLFWGVYHGFFLILERALLNIGAGTERCREKDDRKRKRTDGMRWCLAHLYTLAVVYFGWIFFRADTMGAAVDFIRNMFLPHASVIFMERFLDRKLLLLLTVGLGTCGPVQRLWQKVKGQRTAADGEISVPAMAGYLMVLWLSLLLLVNNTYNPFIYFRF